MGFILNAILSLVTFLFGRIPWKYFAFLIAPFFVLGVLMSAHFGMNWFSSYAFVLIYSSAIGVVFMLLHTFVGGAVERGVKTLSHVTDIEITEKAIKAATRVVFYIAIFLILLIVTYIAIGLPRATAYFLASLVGKEPIRSFDLGYYFATWVDYLKAAGVFLSYIFFFLFVNSIGYLFINEDVKAGEFEEKKPVSKKREKLNNTIYVVTIIIFIYVVPATIAFLFEAVIVPDRTTAYGSLALDDGSERLVWAELNRDGVPDPVFVGGDSGNTGVYAAALDGATGKLLWYRELGGEWCDSDIRSDRERIFTIVRNPDESYDVVALNIIDGSTAWRRNFPSDMLGAINYGDNWGVRDDGMVLKESWADGMITLWEGEASPDNGTTVDSIRRKSTGERDEGIIVFTDTWNYGTIALRSSDGEPVSGVTPYKPTNRVYTYLDETDDGTYYVRRGRTRLFALPLDELDHQISSYYSIKMHDPEYFDTYYRLAYSDDDNTYIIANYKYTYGLIEGRGCDALYCFDGSGVFQWEFANGQLLSIEGALGTNGPLVLIYGSDRNSLPLLVGVNARDGSLLWTWNRYDLIEPPVWERIKRRFEMIFG